MSIFLSSDRVRTKHYDVFVSYKREDDAPREVLCDALKSRGFEPWWDTKLTSGNFRSQLREEINRCRIVIAIWSRNAAARPDEVFLEMSHAFGIKRLLPIKIDDAPIPKQFAQEFFFNFDAWNDPDRVAAQLDSICAEAAKLGLAPKLQIVTGPVSSIQVELGDLPGAPDKLIGREFEMELLRKAWRGGTNAVVLHALGGAGKSALLRAFVNERLTLGGDGADRVYGWSAYSQGSGEQKQADADSFISKALSDFGYLGEPIKDPVERAKTLAKLIQESRVLLLLDGLEPLQDPPKLNNGRFKDKGFATLVKTLAAQNPGLMVLTSRQEVSEIEGFGPLVIHHALEKLSDDAGSDLLVELGVKGLPSELRATVHDLGGHALSITLLGTFIAELYSGDIHQRARFNFSDIIMSDEYEDNLDNTVQYAKRAEKVMAGYLEQFDKLANDAAGLGGPERALLHLVGLFDRPADGSAVEMLLSERIPGINDGLFVEITKKPALFGLGTRWKERQLSNAQRSARLRSAKGRLRKLRLLYPFDPHDPRALDAHPLVRAYMAKLLEQVIPESAKVAHGKLYRHYAASAPDLPETISEMQPLFHAIQHGVKTGLVQETYDNIFERRIRRGNEFFIGNVLGAFTALLALCANFFKRPWVTPNPLLSYAAQAWILAGAAYSLTAMGRIRDSITPRRAGLAAHISSRDWRNAAIDGGQLCTCLLILGDVPNAISAAQKGVEYADLSGEQDQMERQRAGLGKALAAAGEIDSAITAFSEAERISRFSQLIGKRGYDFGDILLERGASQKVLERACEQLNMSNRLLGHGFGIDDIGFAWLLKGRAQDALDDPKAGVSLDSAVTLIRKSGHDEFVPQALLARAAYRRKRTIEGNVTLLEAILEDHAEVEALAYPEMRLYLVDLALERACLHIDLPSFFKNGREEAERQRRIAFDLVAQTGYHRRDRELTFLHSRLAIA